MTGLLVGVAVFLGLLAVRTPSLADTVGAYATGSVPGESDRSTPSQPPGPLAVGAVLGATLSPFGLIFGAMSGAVLGLMGGHLVRRSTARARSRRLGQELPTVADLCSLHILSGDSVIGAMRRLSSDATGVAAAEMASILERVDAGAGFPEAAREAARSSAHRDAARLYELLAQAHRSGARLVDSLEMFAADRRAAIERDLAVEGGRRALTGYGPILGLMIPTTLLFLMYPTLTGLDALSATR